MSKVLKAAKAVSMREDDGRSGTDAPYIYPLVVVALRTGMRKGELFHLRWQHVDFDQRRILIMSDPKGTPSAWETKSGRSRLVPMDDQTFEALTWWKNYFEKELERVSERQLGAFTPQLKEKARHREQILKACSPASHRLVFPSFRTFDSATGEALPMNNIHK